MTVGGDRKSKAQNGLLIKGDTAETITSLDKGTQPFVVCDG